jgi:hypothetical protein
MAVTQISRIQHRRGLEQDLPQLSSAELGWSVDTRQLYIGNGTLEEGAPLVGVTRILTEHDVADITSNTSFYTNYTFVGNAAGYTAQTGPSVLAPVVRNYQDKFDDFVNVRDFGATGDGTTDDTSALNRAIQQIYKSTVSPTDSRARRTIYFPGGTYLTSDTVLIPTYARLVGDGLSSTMIKQVNGNRSVANICDSSFQSGSLIGTNSAVLPIGIELNGINFFNSNSNIAQPILIIDSASNLKINSCTFYANNQPGFYPNLVAILSTNSATSKITFDSCQFTGGGNGISCIGSTVSAVRVLNSGFNDQANVTAHLGSSLGFVGIGNYSNSLNPSNRELFFGNNLNVSLSINDNFLNSGLFLGNFQMTPTVEFTLTTTPLVISLVSNAAIFTSYQVSSGTNYRRGVFKVVENLSSTQYDDEYIETAVSVNANLYANADSFIVSVTSGTATLELNNSRFF